MRLPLHPGGCREMILMTLLLALPAAAGFGCAWRMNWGWCWPLAVLLFLLWLGGLAFFRDPEREVPGAPGLLVSPADGKVVEIVKLDNDDLIGGPATRISIFLSVFNVHVNRSPCAGVVRSVYYRPGQYLDARDPQSGLLNEANTIVIDPDDQAAGPVVVRQIAGLIARRIVCTVKPGERLTRGQRIGLIKFGSRTELIMPGHDLHEPVVRVGDQARGALTVMARTSRGGMESKP